MKIYCIDKWENSNDYTRFVNNMSKYGDQVVHYNVKEFRDGILLLPKNVKFDLLFIDDINAKIVLESLVLAFPLVKGRGLIIVDDYTNSKEHLHNCPKAAIDAFFNVYAPFVKALEFSWQAIFLKRSRPLPWKKCNSEYYHEDLTKI
jgi:hypothetical protein